MVRSISIHRRNVIRPCSSWRDSVGGPISSAWGVSRLSAHLESTLSTLPMSDQTLGRARSGADRYCMTDPGTAVGCEQRCEHLRHGPNLMSDQTSGAWSTCSLDGLTAWKRSEPTKWAHAIAPRRTWSDHVPAVDTNRAYHMLLMDTEAIVCICTAAPDVLDTYSGCRNSLYVVQSS